MGFDLNLQISAVTVFIQGLLSFFSPCVLPLLPLYMSYLAAGTAVIDENGVMRYDRKTVMLHTLMFVIGISAAFFILGLGMSTLGRLFGSHRQLIAGIGGIAVILFGLYQLGVFGNIGFLDRERKFGSGIKPSAMSPLTALLLGFFFSFSWTPCIGPVLSGVLLMAASASGDSAAAGFLLIAVYTAGFVIPFLLVGLFTSSLLEMFRKHRDIVRYTVKIGGVLLILMGVMMLSGQMGRVSSYLSQFGAVSADSGTMQQTTAEDESIAADSDDKNTGAAEDPAAKTDADPYTSEPHPDEDVSKEEARTEAANDGSAKADENSSPSEKVYPAIDFDLVDQYGNRQQLSSYKGKVVFLNFWATWCPPCRAEMPDIQKLYEYYEDHPEENVVILGVAEPGNGQEQSEEGVRKFLEDNGYSYPVAFDTEGRTFMNYAIMSIPTTYMIDENGNMFGYVSGSMSAETMRSIIEQTKSGKR